jgi:hypothetical protein
MNPEKLELLVQEHLNKCAKLIESFDWSDRQVYGNWLAQTYYFVCHSTRLLGGAASRFLVDKDKLHIQLIQHAKEEKSHEKLTVADLKALGHNPKDFSESSSTRALYRTIYYAIDRESPLALYGYIYFLEMWAVIRGQAIRDAAEKAFGKKSVNFLQVHLTEDVDHVKMYTTFFQDFSENELEIVAKAIEDTGTYYFHLLCEIRDAENESYRAA